MRDNTIKNYSVRSVRRRKAKNKGKAVNYQRKLKRKPFTINLFLTNPFNIKGLQVCKIRLQMLITNNLLRLQVCKPLYMPLQIANINY